MKADELAKKREEAERKARRGEIDPMQEFAFQVIGQVMERPVIPILTFTSTGDRDVEA